ncbi:MAG: rhodanese-like domain-containing protein [Phycisphaerales bacterium]|nr:rhodanese-like domain-containing protein [Phycisphaerales bacterium]
MKSLLLKTVVLAVVCIAVGFIHAAIRPLQTEMVTNGTPRPQDGDVPTVVTEPTTDDEPEDTAPEEDPPAVDPPDEPFDIYLLDTYITVEEATKIYDLVLADFIDARMDKDFNTSRIPGAFHIPPDAFFAGRIPEVLQPSQTGYWIQPNQPVVIYCEGGDCDSSKSVGIQLQNLGFQWVYILDPGFPGWVEADLELDTTQLGEGE